MPYIGKSPVAGGFHKLDNLTASATATYALTLGSAAYYPESANQLLVSLNGVIQAPQDSFTVSGSNIVFDSALTASDSIDFIVALGDVIGVGSVTDGAITTAKLGNNAVTSAKLDTNIDIAGTLDVTGALTADSGIYLGGTAAANLMDDYEEGTWTPSYTNLSVGNGTLSANYTKIGNQVTVSHLLEFGSTTSISGQLAIGGFPFAQASTSRAIFKIAGLDSGSFWISLTGIMAPSSTDASIYYTTGVPYNNLSSVDATNPFTWATNDKIDFTMTYLTT